jgi:hypothetical protein
MKRAEIQQQIAELLRTMPDEAFTWFVLATMPSAVFEGAKTQIWPDGAGGFMKESRESINAIREAAKRYMESDD